jgi:hypothetical protein
MDEVTLEATVRSPDHLLRMAMLMHLTQHDDFCVCQECIERSMKIMAYTEDSSPKTLQGLKQTAVANDMEFVVNELEKLGGAADHSTMIRRVQRRMNSTQLKAQIRTLEEGGRVKVGKQGGAAYYILVKEEPSA